MTTKRIVRITLIFNTIEVEMPDDATEDDEATKRLVLAELDADDIDIDVED